MPDKKDKEEKVVPHSQNPANKGPLGDPAVGDDQPEEDFAITDREKDAAGNDAKTGVSEPVISKGASAPRDEQSREEKPREKKGS